MRGDSLNGKYDDIIDLPHRISPHRKRMSARDRAAQFAPFSALTGYDAHIAEAARLTDDRPQPDEYILAQLDMKLKYLLERANEPPKVTLTYFKPDERKSGGRYITSECRITRIDESSREVFTTDGQRLPIDDITAIDSEIFEIWNNDIV